MGFIWYIIIGIVAGFLAGKIMRGGGFGLIINLLLGILGGVLGGWVFALFGLAASGFRIDWKSDYFHSRCCSGVMDCFVVLEISMSSSILYNLLI